MSLASSEPTSTQRPITLWLDRCAPPQGREQLAKAPPATDMVHRKLAACTTSFRAGTGWLFIMVPDAAAVAARQPWASRRFTGGSGAFKYRAPLHLIYRRSRARRIGFHPAAAAIHTRFFLFFFFSPAAARPAV